MRRDLVGNDAFTHIVLVRQSEMLFRGDIAQHGRAVPADHRRANRGGNVIVAGGNIGGQRPQGVERRLTANGQLFFHVFFDQLHRDMARAFDHDLHVVLPGNLG